MRGSPKRSAVVLCGRNLRASPFDRVETKNLCLLVSYMPLAFIPAATSGLCGFLRTVRSVGLPEAPLKPSEIPDEHESHTSRKPLGW